MDLDLSFFGFDLSFLLMQYGSFALFILLGMGIFGLPVPEETLMALAGILMSTGHLAIVPAILAAYLGTVLGITISYLLGKIAGYAIIKSYGKLFYIDPKALHQTPWIISASKWMLLIGYLIPGLRHCTGIFAGSAAMRFKEFALFAYSGAALWVVLYLSIGYFWGNDWFANYAIPFQYFEMTMDILSAVVILIFAIYVTYQIKLKKR